VGTIDWTIVGVVFVTTLLIAKFTNQYTKSVADFLAANRGAGRYLLTGCEGAAGLGAISIIAVMEMYFKSRFCAQWWGLINLPILALLCLSGWIIYRFRKTRCFTLTQFFELRYSKNFRKYAGILCFTSGLINFGIFPSVGANFFVNFCGLPTHIPILGFTVSSYALVMFILLFVALILTFSGGQVTVLVAANLGENEEDQGVNQ
jgi:solute:Na+ symporter, SSS family